MKNKNLNNFLIGAGVVVGGYLVYKASQGVQVVADVIATDLNPASDNNIVQRFISKPVTRALTGGKKENAGSALFCFFNSNSTQCNPKAKALNRIYDTSKMSAQQIELLWEQEKDFLSPQSGIQL